MSEAEFRLKQLMLLGLDGDAAAYRALLSSLAQRLRAYYSHRLGHHAADAEDLVQETLIAMHERRISYDRTQPLTAWVYAIARHKLVDHFRRARVRITVPLLDEDLFPSEDDAVGQVAAQHDLERLLATLPEATQEAIRLTRIEGLSIDETAKRTGKSSTATKVSIHRGLRRLSQGEDGSLDADD